MEVLLRPKSTYMKRIQWISDIHKGMVLYVWLHVYVWLYVYVWLHVYVWLYVFMVEHVYNCV